MQNAKQAAATALSAASAAVAHAVDHLTAHLTLKRTMDLVLGTALLALAAPALTIGAAALALRAGRRPGGVLSRETRVGLGGRPFQLRSLRTRRLRLDLLSRLPHVVRGELSLVGPAPSPRRPGSRRAGMPQPAAGAAAGADGLAQVRARSKCPGTNPPSWTRTTPSIMGRDST
ncbi:sugar transferase [Streptomyces sp. M10(2022)]